jgi:hypothetical protein
MNKNKLNSLAFLSIETNITPTPEIDDDVTHSFGKKRGRNHFVKAIFFLK